MGAGTRSSMEYLIDKVPCWSAQGTCKCRVHVGQVYECSVFEESIKLGHLAGKGPVWWLGGARIQAGVSGRHKCMLVLEESVHMHVLVKLVGVLCACTNDLQL